MEFINVFEDSYPLYELCRKEGWTDAESYDEWRDSGGELSFYEGDPDIIKINSVTGYFAKVGQQIFYWFDEFYGNAEKMLRKFFSTYKTGTTLGGESWISGLNPRGVTDKESWDDFRRLQTGIAYRGGAGYTYWISDWSKYYRQYVH